MLALVPFRDLTERPFPELCRADLIVRDHGRLVLTGGFPLLYWPGRAIYDGRRLFQRLALYDNQRRLGVFDDARYHINDVAIHPTDPVLAIATGEYDGGYYFEGELWQWNWQTGERRLLLESREVRRCRFEPDGLLTIVVKPVADTDQSDYGLTFDPRVAVDVRDLVGCRPADFGFDDDLEGRALANAVARGELGIEHRAVIWDLAWTFNNRIAVARDDGHVELWSSAGKLEHVIRSGGNVVQLLRQPAQLLVHVSAARSELHVLRGNQLELWMELPGRYICSVDATGRILARQLDPSGGRQDLLVTASKKILVEGDLGHYDAFNHFLRIDGAEELFLLRGTPMSSHEHKRLCAIAPGDIVAAPEFAWDTEDEHRMTGSAVILDEDVVCCYRVHQSRGGGAIRIERRIRASGEVVWRHEVRAAASALIVWPAVRGVVAALVDGSICVLDGDGGVLLDEPFEIDGVRTIPTALLVHEETLIVGTIDGRISLRSLR